MRVRGGIIYFGISEVAGKAFGDIAEAGGDVIGRALGQHFHGTIGQVFYKAGKVISPGNPVSGETKSDALDGAGENYVFGNGLH